MISVLSNLLPDKVKSVVDAAAAGDFATAKQKHLELFGLCKGCLTLATNPIPIKAAMQIAGMDTGEVRLPLTELEDGPRKKLQALLDSVLPVTAAK